MALRSAVILFPVLLLAQTASLDDAARELARKIAAATGGQPGALTVRVLSTLSPGDADQVRRTLEAQLPKPATQVQEPIRVEVTLSENARSWVWTAEIRRGDETSVVMVTAPRPAEAPGERPNQLTLEKRLVFESEEPILDLAPLENGLLVLGRAALSLYEKEGEQWALRSAARLTGNTPPSRDARGRLIVNGNSFRAYLTAMVCEGQLAAPLAADCNDGAPWPSEFGEAILERGRNYFSDGKLPAFFTGAPAAGALAGIDGRAHILDQEGKAAGTVDGWGSDLAGIESGCGGRQVVLVTKPGDASEADSIQAFEIVNGQAVSASVPAAFTGPVTALWTAADKKQVIAVSRDLKTRRYAAFSLVIPCSR